MYNIFTGSECYLYLRDNILFCNLKYYLKSKYFFDHMNKFFYMKYYPTDLFISIEHTT